MDRVFSKESLSHALSGSLSSILALALVYPLDQVRILKQVEGDGRRGAFVAEDKYRWAGMLAPVFALLESRGVSDGVYKGFYVQQIALGLSNFIYFYMKNMASAAVTAASGRVLGPTEEFAVTTVAGAVNATAAAPLWNICDKIKTDNEGRYNGILDCIQQLTAAHGVAHLWNGVQAGLLLVSNPIIHYYSYNQLKKLVPHSLIRRGGALHRWQFWVFFLLGVLSKTLATIATYPLQTAQSVLRSMMGTAWRQTAKKAAAANEDLEKVEQHFNAPTARADAAPHAVPEDIKALPKAHGTKIQPRNSATGWPSLQTSAAMPREPKHHTHHTHRKRQRFKGSAPSADTSVSETRAGRKGQRLADAVGALATAIKPESNLSSEAVLTHEQASTADATEQPDTQTNENPRMLTSQPPTSDTDAHFSEEPTVLTVLRDMYMTEGVTRWYRGMEAKLWVTVTCAGFQVAFHEQLEKTVSRLLGIGKH